MAIHPTAVIDPHAELDSGVEVGPYAVIEGGVRIGANTRIGPHVYLARGARIGTGCALHPFCVVGNVPQDRAFRDAPTYAVVGDDTIIREGVSVHRGTIPESATVIGRRCFLLANSHVAHNCVLGDDVTLVNAALLAGHVHVGDRAFVGGGAAVHQFVRIGEIAMIAGGASVRMDVPPFVTVAHTHAACVNVIGLRRAGFDPAQRQEIRDCFKTLYRGGGALAERIGQIERLVRTDAGRRLVAFLRAPSKRGLIGGRRDRTAAEAAEVGET